MDEKYLDTKTGTTYSDSSEIKDEDIGDILSSNSSETSLDKKCVFELSVAEDCSINHENYNTSSDAIGEKFRTVSYVEMDKTNRIGAFKKSSYGPEYLISTRSRAFTEYREQSGYSDDNSASGTSTVNVSDEEEVSPSQSFERKLFSSELKNYAYIASCSYVKNTTNSYAGDTQTSSSTPQIDKSRQISDTLHHYFDGREEYNKIATYQQPIIKKSESHDESIFAFLSIKPSLRQSYGILNPLEDFSSIISSLNKIIPETQGPQSDGLSFIGNRSSNESDISDKSKKFLKNDDLVLTDMKEMELCPKLSPIEDGSGKDESLNNISEAMTCSDLLNNNENIRKNYSSLKNREGISPTLDTLSVNEENLPNETHVRQYNTFKRSLSYSPTRQGESKIIKLSSPAESPTRTLRNVDINLTKRPASPDDNLSTKSHDMMQEVKKQNVE